MIKALHVSQTLQINREPLPILTDINLDIGRGESVAIIGASGSGKTTLLGILAGLALPSEGQVFLADKEITAMDEEQRAITRRNHVGFVFQNFQLLDSLTALENIMLPLEVKGREDPENVARHFLDRVGLAHRPSHYPRQLSGGEQQRVALARAFACEAPIIFADEPTGNLDSRTGQSITELLFELNREQETTLVMVTHSTELAQRCHRQLEMHAGSLDERA